MEMEKKLKLTELAEYYVDRYDIETYDDDSVVTTLRQKIKRLLSGVPVGETTLYAAINKKSKAREISVEEFEKYCFAEWAKFLLGKIRYGGGYVALDNSTLIDDLKRNNIDLEWIKKAERINEEYNAIHEREYSRTEEEEDYIYIREGTPITTEDELKKKGYGMILEAIYSVFFEAFNWDKLKSDMDWERLLDTGYNADNPPDVFKAIEQLKDYRNYIGKRKK